MIRPYNIMFYYAFVLLSTKYRGLCFSFEPFENRGQLDLDLNCPSFICDKNHTFNCQSKAVFPLNLFTNIKSRTFFGRVSQFWQMLCFCMLNINGICPHFLCLIFKKILICLFELYPCAQKMQSF